MERRRDAGFTLLEVLIAVAILGFVSLGIAGLFLHAVETNASGFDYALVSSEARRALETLQSLPYNDAALAVTTTPVDVDTTLTGFDTRQKFQIRYTVTEYSLLSVEQVQAGWNPLTAGGIGNVKRITLTAEVWYGDEDSQFFGKRVGNRRLTVTGLKVAG